MGQKTHPVGFRLGTIRGWDSNWYATKKEIAGKIFEDEEIRRYLVSAVKTGWAQSSRDRTYAKANHFNPSHQ